MEFREAVTRKDAPLKEMAMQTNVTQVLHERLGISLLIVPAVHHPCPIVYNPPTEPAVIEVPKSKNRQDLMSPLAKVYGPPQRTRNHLMENPHDLWTPSFQM